MRLPCFLLICLCSAVHCSTIYRRNVESTNNATWHGRGKNPAAPSDAEVSKLCPNVNGPEPVFISSPYYCEEFFICDNGVAWSHICPEPLYFNPGKQVCDFASNVDCSSQARKPASLLKGEQTCEGSDELLFFRSPSDCSSFYQCHEGFQHTYSCPQGLVFDENLQICSRGSDCDLRSAGTATFESLPSRPSNQVVMKLESLRRNMRSDFRNRYKVLTNLVREAKTRLDRQPDTQSRIENYVTRFRESLLDQIQGTQKLLTELYGVLVEWRNAPGNQKSQ